MRYLLALVQICSRLGADYFLPRSFTLLNDLIPNVVTVHITFGTLLQQTYMTHSYPLTHSNEWNDLR